MGEKPLDAPLSSAGDKPEERGGSDVALVPDLAAERADMPIRQ